MAALGTLAAAAPAVAGAATVSVTGDDGNPVGVPPGAPPTIRNMRPDVGVAFPPGDARYSLQVTNAAGAAASSGLKCFRTTFLSPDRVAYSGNGAYTATVSTYAADDTSCTKALTTEAFTFVIGASTSIAPPAGPHQLRAFGSFVTNPLLLAVNLNPGATNHEVRFAKDARLAPDGSIVGGAGTAYVDASTGMARASFDGPGVYTFVARPTRYGSAGEVGGPWSPPVTVVVRAPFDFKPGIDFTDSRGPSYRVRATLREASARGTVRISLARGTKGGKYRSLGTATISKTGTISKRFTARRTGKYRLRFTYRGSKTIAAGSGTIVIQVRRVFGS